MSEDSYRRGCQTAVVTLRGRYSMATLLTTNRARTLPLSEVMQSLDEFHRKVDEAPIDNVRLISHMKSLTGMTTLALAVTYATCQGVCCEGP